MKEFIYRFYFGIALFAILCILVLQWLGPLMQFLGALMSQSGSQLSSSVPLDVKTVSLILGFVYFVQKQKTEDVKFFNKLFDEFNSRYDSYNETLNSIIDDEDKSRGFNVYNVDDSVDICKTSHRMKVLNDYFNLCAEEYFYYKKDVIYKDVWQSWRSGMQYFYNNDTRIQNMWNKAFDVAGDSYYGFTKEELLKVATRK